MILPMPEWMTEALKEAQTAFDHQEVPVGCVIVSQDHIIAKTHNLVETMRDPLAHAEILAIQAATRLLKTPYLTDCDLYVTLEPCTLCAAAISFARLRRLYFGAYDSKGGGVDHGARFYQQPTCLHKVDWYGGIHEKACADLLKRFFKNRR
jgi:tRNA(adenine34) deaminase